MRAYCGKKAKTGPAQNKDRRGYSGGSKGSLKIVGIGPGDIRHISQRVREAIEECEVIVGYNTYIKLLGDLTCNKEIESFGMKEEIRRAGSAIGHAKRGRRVCLISSGDPGVYGMAGLVLELLKKGDLNKLKIEICPGISAATACAALLGAPLTHDFAVISLSDLLTDLELIKRRIELAVKADFVIVLYNPKSSKRIIPFQKTCDCLLKYKSADTPVGIARNAYRYGEEITITTLGNMPSFKEINMATTIIIGNSKTYIKDKYMITPRGYNFK
ncbi:MAG: precorrin-3B C(17)-methyltransferase [Candidatus Omnitrophota bacterium]|nr:precorrin-3B C(17)-methyltransferase [Candidatus Omnitrophota bacterium]